MLLVSFVWEDQWLQSILGGLHGRVDVKEDEHLRRALRGAGVTTIKCGDPQRCAGLLAQERKAPPHAPAAPSAAARSAPG
jgi:hypothetical protein